MTGTASTKRTHPDGAENLVAPTQLWKGTMIALMTVGAMSMWLFNPMFWLWVTGRLQDSTQPSMGPYGLLLLGIILTCVAIGKGISELHRYYQRRTGSTPTIRIIMPWRRSLRGGRSRKREIDGRHPTNVLDVIMVMTAVLAVGSFTAWYVITNPTPPGIGGPGPAKKP